MIEIGTTSCESGKLSFGWATSQETQVVLNHIRSFQRQSMNLRIMQDARLFVCRKERAVIGWIGISTHHFDGYAEYFSLFIKPEYRGLGLGLFLELVVVEEAEKNGHQYLHFRVDSKVEARLTESRYRSGFIQAFEPTPIVRDLCTHCELHGSLCKSQKFMKIDVSKRKEQLQSQLKNYSTVTWV